MARYSRVAPGGGGYNPVMSQSISPAGLVASPYMMSREEVSEHHQMAGMKKDDKYWERRRSGVAASSDDLQ